MKVHKLIDLFKLFLDFFLDLYFPKTYHFRIKRDSSDSKKSYIEGVYIRLKSKGGKTINSQEVSKANGMIDAELKKGTYELFLVCYDREILIESYSTRSEIHEVIVSGKPLMRLEELQEKLDHDSKLIERSIKQAQKKDHYYSTSIVSSKIDLTNEHTLNEIKRQLESQNFQFGNISNKKLSFASKVISPKTKDYHFIVVKIQEFFKQIRPLWLALFLFILSIGIIGSYHYIKMNKNGSHSILLASFKSKELANERKLKIEGHLKNQRQKLWIGERLNIKGKKYGLFLGQFNGKNEAIKHQERHQKILKYIGLEGIVKSLTNVDY